MTTMEMLANVSSGKTVLNDAEMSDLAQAATLEINRRDAELAELRKDKERLDWLDKQGTFLTRPLWEIYGKDINCETIRQAIDAASQAGVKGGEKV